jgi:hypothetical protein
LGKNYKVFKVLSRGKAFLGLLGQGEGRREKGEGRREKGEGANGGGAVCVILPKISGRIL